MKSAFYKDPHWYIAFLLAIFFWWTLDLFFIDAHPRNLFNEIELLIVSVLFYPIIEEILFRGLLQGKLLTTGYLRGGIYEISFANILTSILFSLSHLIQHDLVVAVAVFVPSLIFGYFRDRHKSVAPSIYLHIFYNAGFLSMFVR